MCFWTSGSMETGNKPMKYTEASLEIQKQTTKSQWVAAQEAAADASMRG